MKLIIITLGFALATIGCSDKNTSESPVTKQTLETELHNLLLRSNEDRYVIVEEPSSEAFVQFVTTDSNTLFFDVPTMAMSSEEKKRAKTFFRKHGVTDQYRSELLFNPDNQKEFRFEVWQMDAGDNPAFGAELAEKALVEIYNVELKGTRIITH